MSSPSPVDGRASPDTRRAGADGGAAGSNGAPAAAKPAHGRNPSYHAMSRFSTDSDFDDAIDIDADDDALLDAAETGRSGNPFRGYDAAPPGGFGAPGTRKAALNWTLIGAAATAFIMVAVYLLLPSAPPPPPPRTSTVVVVSLDGFRPSYLTPDVTPNLHSLANGGALAEYMLPVFPSVTFPNHYSIATGLWPIWHGIVNNVFHAPDVAEPDGNGGSTVGKFDHGPARDSRYWLGEPIWTTLEYNGVTTGSVMFPGSMAPHGPNNTVPTHLIDFDPNWSAARKVDQVVEWLSLPETRTGRPQLTMLYIGDVDATGHGYGPYAPQMNDTLRAVDKAVGDLVSRARAAVPGITFVVLSDHGMAQIEDNTTIALDDFLDLSLAEVITHSPIAFIQPRNASDTQGIYERLKNASDSGPAAGKWRVWLKEEIPDQWHYSDSGRISPIVALPVDGWTFVIKSTGEGRGKWIRGTHGFAPDHPDMRAFFAVNGPGVKAGSRISGGMRNTEVYSIVARLVGGKGYERRWRMAPTNWTQEWRDKVGEVLLDGW